MPVRFSAQVATKMRRLLLICGVAALALPGVASAATIQYSLPQLLPGGNTSGGFTIGDKRYSGFEFSSTGSHPLIPSDVNVRVTSSDTNAGIPGDDTYALQFTFGMDAFPGERTDLVLSYRVDVLDPAMFINRVGLGFNGSVPSQGPGNAAASVIETVSTAAAGLDGPPVTPGSLSDTAILDVFNDGPGRLADNNQESIAVNPTRTLFFVKDILVSSEQNGGYVAVSFVDNVINQVPEPSVIGLMALAGGGLLFRRRR